LGSLVRFGQGGVHVTVLQAWIVFGVPGLLLTAGLFVGRSKRRAWLGYAVLVAMTAAFFFVPGGGPSAAVVGLVAAMFVATGRGSRRDDLSSEHHEQRRRYTVARDDAENAPAP
jgi:hypothetical protein